VSVLWPPSYAGVTAHQSRMLLGHPRHMMHHNPGNDVISFDSEEMDGYPVYVYPSHLAR
jgi:hypothetical protein